MEELIARWSANEVDQENICANNYWLPVKNAPAMHWGCFQRLFASKE